jgi:hypothetical protein
MSVYRRRADASSEYSQYKLGAVLLFVSFVATAFASNRLDFGWLQRSPVLANISTTFFPLSVMGAIFSFGLIFAVHYGLQNMMTLRIEITNDGISRAGGPQKEIFLPWDEVAGYSECKRSIIVRSFDPTRNILIPSDLAGYENLHEELRVLGIREVNDLDASHIQESWLLAAAILAVSFLLLLPKLHIASQNLSVAAALFGIAYVGFRNQFRRKSSTLLVLLIFLGCSIGLAFQTSLNQASEGFYLGVAGAAGCAMCLISFLREHHSS